MRKFIYILLLFGLTFTVAKADITYNTHVYPSSYGNGQVIQKTGVMTSCDPYYVIVDRNKYYAVKANSDGSYTYKSLLGCDGLKKSTLFDSLAVINGGIYDYTALTSAKLRNAGVRFVKLEGKQLAINDPSKDLSYRLIDYIDMYKLKSIHAGLASNTLTMHLTNNVNVQLYSSAHTISKAKEMVGQ